MIKLMIFLSILSLNSCDKKRSDPVEFKAVASKQTDNFEDLKDKKETGCKDKGEEDIKEFKLQGGSNSGCEGE